MPRAFISHRTPDRPFVERELLPLLHHFELGPHPHAAFAKLTTLEALRREYLGEEAGHGSTAEDAPGASRQG